MPTLREISGRIFAQRVLALAGICGPVLFFTIFTTLGLARPGFNPLRQTISALAIGPGGWIQSVNFLLCGVLLIAFGVGWERGIQGSRTLPIAIILFAILGTLTALMAFFPSDAAGAGRSWWGHIHQLIFHGISFLFPVFCFLASSRLRRDPRWWGFDAFSIALGVLAVILMAGWLGLSREALRPWKGLYERVYIGAALVWVEVMAVRLFNIS